MLQRLIDVVLAFVLLFVFAGQAHAQEHHVLWLGLREVHTLVGNECMPTITGKHAFVISGFCKPTDDDSPVRVGQRHTTLQPNDTFEFEASFGDAHNPCRPKGKLRIKDRSKAAQTLTVKCGKVN